MKSIASITILWIFSWSLTSASAQGNTSCLTGSTGLDWYTKSVGETPCQTYQRLRQICNSNYVVGSLSSTSAPDVCNDQVSGCCCNSISYALLMLCLNCQQGEGQGTSSGLDGSPGLYQAYLDNCTPVYNQTLPKDIQWAVCNNKIKIFDDLYSLFWNTGAWFYIFTRDTIQKDQQALANNTFRSCTSTTINSTTTASGSISVTSSSDGTTSTNSPIYSSHANTSLSGGTIAGIITGAVTALLVVGMLVWFFRMRHSTEYLYNAVHSDEYTVEPFASVSPYVATAAAATLYPYARSSANPTGNDYTLAPHPISIPQRQSEKGRVPVISQTGSYNNTTPSTSQALTSTLTSSLPAMATEAFTDHHADGGPLLIARSASGRLPPAYGEQLRLNS